MCDTLNHIELEAMSGRGPGSSHLFPFLLVLILPAGADNKSKNQETLQCSRPMEMRKCFLERA
jgi:hypothetical protein